MDFDLQELKEKIDLYFAGNLSKNSLGEWCKCAYHDLLTGEYIEQKKIVIYPFLKTLSTLHIQKDDLRDEYPCSEEEVRKIQHILNGKENASFSISVGFPFQVYNMFKCNPYFNKAKRAKYLQLKEIVDSYKNSGTFSKDESIKCAEIVQEVNEENITLLNLLEQQISKIFLSAFDLKGDTIQAKKDLALYAQRPNTNIEKLLDYLECYAGTQNLNLYIAYVKGHPQTSFII